MKRTRRLAGVVVTCTILVFGLSSGVLYAADYATLTKMFHGYKGAISNFADALYANNWEKGKTIAEDLVKRSKVFNNMANKEYETEWGWETQGMINHSEELVELCDEKASNDAYFVSAALFLHLNHVTASTPYWLRDHLGEMVKQATNGVAKKDKGMALDAGEEIHLAAHELSLSGQIMEHMFANTRWIKDARRMHILGDEFQASVDKGDWNTAKKQLDQIEEVYKKVVMSFKR
ncbi:MAG: hypothetical protein AB1711_04455 [Thermodesulfobacteriota bacterium]